MDLSVLAQRIIIDKIAERGGLLLTRESKISLALSVLCALFVLTACGFFIYAAYVWLEILYDTHIAAALTALFALTVALMMFLVSLQMANVRKNRLAQARDEMNETLQNALQLLDGEMSEIVHENPKTALFLASLAGFAAAKKFL